MSDLTRITQIIEPEASALGFDLVRVMFTQNEGEYALQIMAERPETGQLTIDDCAALSRRVSLRFDEMEEQGDDLIDQAYRLEVSSPGIDRPLTRPKDYANWTGHDAKLHLDADGVEATGRKTLAGPIISAEGPAITIDDRKNGKITVSFDQIASGKLLLTDRLIAATAPLDSSGAEEIYEEQDE